MRDITKKEADAYFEIKDDEKIARAVVSAFDAVYKSGLDEGFDRGHRAGKSAFNHWAFLPVVITCIITTSVFVATLRVGLFFAGATDQ